MKRTETTVAMFQESLWRFYDHQGRHDLPWRQVEADGGFNPYKILVSEIMLQQTQVGRVLPKYHEFLERFPTVMALAEAPLGDVLKLWSGLGYNRRAKFLHQAAQTVQVTFHGNFPEIAADLVRLPGVGANTAGAIMAYAFNQPVVFVETNIRTVYIHHFFATQTRVTDRDILAVVAQSLDQEHPREFYWALMDYGSYLKRAVGNASKYSQTYAKQSAFAGSKRQVRGEVIRLLGEAERSLIELREIITDERLTVVLADLVTEGLIQRRGTTFYL